MVCGLTFKVQRSRFKDRSLWLIVYSLSFIVYRISCIIHRSVGREGDDGRMGRCCQVKRARTLAPVLSSLP